MEKKRLRDHGREPILLNGPISLVRHPITALRKPLKLIKGSRNFSHGEGEDKPSRVAWHVALFVWMRLERAQPLVDD